MIIIIRISLSLLKDMIKMIRISLKIKQKVSLKIYIKNLNLENINNSVNKKRLL